jgi:TetR/AcrR family transcriptional regulator
MSENVPSRRDAILQTLAGMLESTTNGRITTAALAREVGVSEAALYRHFASKAKMYEGLLEFAEETLFSAINTLSSGQGSTETVCGNMLLVVLTFAERNPGITRLLCGDALHGEKVRLQARAGLIFERLESEIKQAIRQGELKEALKTRLPPGQAAALMVNVAEGKLRHFVRSHYRLSPTSDWPLHWQVISSGIFPH